MQQLIDNERELEQYRLNQAAKFKANASLMKEINEKFNKDRDVLRVQIQYFSNHYNKGGTLKKVQKWLGLAKWTYHF